MDERSLRPPSEPNDNTPEEAAPGTVGPPTATPGDPDGVVVDLEATFGPPPPPIARPAAWSGWPSEWNTPWWSGTTGLESLTDTAWLCLDLNASLLATMPPYLVGAADTLATDWLNNPDPTRYASWEDFAKQLWWDYQLGEAFVLATAYYATGYPARFHVVDPWLVNVELEAGGARSYNIGGLDITPDVLHIRYRTRSAAARGQGPLEVGASRLVAADLLSRYSNNVLAGGGVVPSVLTHPERLNRAQAQELQAQWLEARMAAFGLPAVLSGGVKWEQTSITPEDLGLVELAQFNESRIAVLLGVPPFLAGLPSGGDSLTYSNITSLFDYHWRAGLRPKAQTVCAALSGWALPRGTILEVNRDEYVRPDPKTRAETWQILVGLGVLTVEQVQAIERVNAGASIPVGAVQNA